MKQVLKRINALSLAFLASHTLEDIFQVVSREGRLFFNAQYCSIYLEEQGELKKVYASSPTLANVRLRSKKSYTYQSFRTHKTFVVGIEDFEKNYPEMKQLGIQTAIFVPFTYQKKSVGVLVLQSKKRIKLSTEERQLAKLLGSMASLAIQKSQLVTERQEAIDAKNQLITVEKMLEKINQSGLRLLEPYSKVETYRIIIQEAVILISGMSGAIFLVENDTLQKVYDSSAETADLYPRPKGFTYQAYKKKKAYAIHTKDFINMYPSLHNIKTTLFIPLSYRNKSIGVLQIRSQEEQEFNIKELNMFKIFGSMASSAIRKAQLNDEMKKAVEVRDLFIAMAAHELRTPLTTLNGYIHLLYGKYKKDNSQTGIWIYHLFLESRRLTKLVSELLEVNRIRSGQFEYIWREYNMSHIVQRTITNFHITHPTREIIFENKCREMSDRIIGDFDKLLQVFTNIVENAAKYSLEDRPIHITLQSKKSFVILAVTDQGKGIPEIILSHIFDEFYRGSQEEEGMGIGMFIAKNIINEHKGLIKVFSKINKGTTFEIYLPKAKL